MFWFDFNWQIQSLLNQFWWQINFLLLVILVIIGYFSYKKPIYAVGLTIICLPTYLFRSKIGFLPFTYLELCILTTFLGWLIKKKPYKLRAQSDKLKSYAWPILIILLASTVSLFIAPNKTAAAGLWKAYFIEPILFLLVLIDVLKTDSDRKKILWALGLSTLPISILAVGQEFNGFGIALAHWFVADHRRVTSIYTSPNAVGLFLGPILLVYLGWLALEIKKYKTTILKLLIILPAGLAVGFTFSQGTWLGLAAGVIFLMAFGWNKRITALVVLMIIILALIIPAIRNPLWPVLTFADQSGQNRLALWQMSQNFLLSSPKNFIFGAGIFGFSQIESQARNPAQLEALLYPHNIILNFWLELGLLGLIGFGWLIAKLFKQGFQAYKLQTINYKLLSLGLLAAIMAVLVHGLIDVPYFKNDLALLFWIMVGLL